VQLFIPAVDNKKEAERDAPPWACAPRIECGAECRAGLWPSTARPLCRGGKSHTTSPTRPR
jgi:hypothetical protein